jgi:hypothetical protein
MTNLGGENTGSNLTGDDRCTNDACNSTVLWALALDLTDSDQRW